MGDRSPRHLPDDPGHYTMSLGDHLDELRKRVFHALIVPLPLAVLLFFFADFFIEWLLIPLQKVQLAWGFPPEVQVLSPPEFLMLQVKLSFILALILSMPWLLWQAWLFVGPGLYPRERRFVYLLLPGSFLLTITGILVMYFVMLPLILQVLMLLTRGVEVPAQLLPAGNSNASSLVIPMEDAPPESASLGQFWIDGTTMTLKIAVAGPDDDHVQLLQIPMQGGSAVMQVFRLSSYINFTLLLLLSIAVAFQLPLVLLLMSWMGIVDADTLRGKRRWALLICAVVSAITTPPDAFSMILMLLPLYFLYEFGIVLVALLPADRVAGPNTTSDGDQAA